MCTCVHPLGKGPRVPLFPKRGPHTRGAREGHEERTVRKMKEILEQLWRDFCFEQNIESGPICMADVADFFDFVELMTDTFADDGK